MTNSPSNQAIRMATTNFPTQISKVRSIKGFGEDIGQLSLSVYVSHLNVSFPSLYDLLRSDVSSQGVSFSCGRLDFLLQKWH
jgi:hypothetical protein